MNRIVASVLAGSWISWSAFAFSAPSPPQSPGGRSVDGDGRAWMPSDSIAVRYFVPEAITPSPDGKKFFFTSFHGDLQCDCNVYELTVFSTLEVKDALQARASLEGQSLKPLLRSERKSYRHGGPEFWNSRWRPGADVIEFEGLDERGLRQVYEIDVGTGRVVPVTSWPHGARYPKRIGDAIIGDVAVPLADAQSPAIYPTHAVGRADILSVFAPEELRVRHATFASYRRGVPRELGVTNIRLLVPSPTHGQRIMALGSPLPKAIPSLWHSYDRISARLKPNAGAAETIDVPTFWLIDAQEGTDKPVFQAPSGLATTVGREAARLAPPGAYWDKDGSHVVLVNSALPLRSERDEERKSMAFIVGYDAVNAEWHELEPLQVHDRVDGSLRRVTEVGWLNKGTDLLVKHEINGKAAAGTVYRVSKGRWVGRTVSAALKPVADSAQTSSVLAAGLRVKLRQGANDPPVMIASDGKRELRLTEADPALSGIWRAPTVPFQWREPGGQTRTGGLQLPKSAAKGLPLVIQAYKYLPETFAPDGPSTSGYAAQSLVARGMAVLTVTIPALDSTKVSTPLELTEFVTDLDSAIDALAEKNLVDPSRVGVIGFSRAGFATYYTVTHPGKTLLAAAIVEDGFPGTYAYNLDQQVVFGAPFVSPYGGTFWENKESWLRYEPSFNVDRSKTPTLFTLHNQTSISYAFETIAAFAMNKRPVEYLSFPEGKHELEMPLERLASQTASVEWMTFWLQGVRPSDAERAARWDAMKEAWDKIRGK